MEVDATIVPGQTAIRDQPPGLTFEVVYYILISDIEHGSWRKNGSPVSHQLPVTAVIAA
jgi:hypothetical protein